MQRERERERKREEGKAGKERKGRARIPEHTEPLLSQDLTWKGRRPKSPRRISSNDTEMQDARRVRRILGCA